MAHTETRRLDTYRKTLLDYYEEEIMGEAYFDALTEYFDGKGERDKLHLLTRVERCAAEAVRPLLSKHDLMPREEPVLESLGEADEAAHQDYDWHVLMAYMVARYPGYVDDFETLERLAPEADLPALKQLTQHEFAVIEFASREVSGASNSTEPLHQYLERCTV